MENINVTELNIILSVFIVFYIMFLIGLYRYNSKHRCTKKEHYTNDGSSSNGSSNSGSSSSSSSETCESLLTSCESARSMYAYGSGLLCCVCCSFVMVLFLVIMFMAYKLSQQ